MTKHVMRVRERGNTPRFTYRTMLDAGTLTAGHTGRDENEPVKNSGERILRGREDYALARKEQAKLDRLVAEQKGDRPRFVPKSEREKGKGETVKAELPRYDPKPREAPSRLIFEGRSKLKVRGFGPWG